MYKKRSLPEKIILIILSLLAIAFFLIPIYWLLTTSLKFRPGYFLTQR